MNFAKLFKIPTLCLENTFERLLLNKELLSCEFLSKNLKQSVSVYGRVIGYSRTGAVKDLTFDNAL